MLIVGNISVAATDFSGVGICLEGERFSGLKERCGIGVDIKFVEEDSAR
jgi:hypothetical protein